MEGHAEVGTVDAATGKPKNGTLKYQLTDPRTAAEFAPLWDKASNNWTVLPSVNAWFNEAEPDGEGSGKQQGSNGSAVPGVQGKDARYGPLTVGFGCGDGNGGAQSNLIGPEYGFGFGLNDPNSALKGQKVLIIKTAWGGKTLAGDYRPPSSSGETMWCSGSCPRGVGHYSSLRENHTKIKGKGLLAYDTVVHSKFTLSNTRLLVIYGVDFERLLLIMSTDYTTMLEDVAKILAPGVIGKMYPDLAALTPKLSGFGWHQGWNDGCSLNQVRSTSILPLLVMSCNIWSYCLLI